MILGMSQVLQAQDSLLYGVFPVKEGRITYQKIIPVDSVSNSELIRRGREWAVNIYKAKNDTSQIEDKDQGLLTYKGSVTVLFHEPGRRIAAEWNCGQTITLTCRDNKAAIIISDFEQRAPSGYGTITSARMEKMKAKTDSLPNSVFFGKNNKKKYWEAELTACKDLDNKIKTLIASLELSLKAHKPQ